MVLQLNPVTGELDLVGTGSGGGGNATDLTGDSGGKVTGGVGDNIDLIGDATQAFLSTIGTPASNKMEIKLVKPDVDGQLLIGHTANGEPSVATLTQGSGISITNGPGSITIASTASSSLTVETDGSDAAAAAGVLQIIGGTGASTNGSGNTVTITASANVPTTFNTDSGSAVPVGNALAVNGGTGINTSGAGAALTINLDTPVIVANGGTGATTLTDGGIMLGSGAGAVTVTGQPTNGQLLIGSTGVDPVLGTLTAPAAGLTVTEGAGSITFALANDLSAVEGLATTGMVARTAAETWVTRTITGSSGITVTNGDGVAAAPDVALTVPVTEALGGTNQTTYNKGDVIYSNASNSLAKLGIGTQNQVMTVSATGIPQWSSPVVETVGGTNQTSYAKGDILYASAVNTISKLPIGADGEVLTVSTDIPSWAAIGSGGGGTWTLITSVDLTGVTSSEVTTGLGTAYDEYLWIAEDITGGSFKFQCLYSDDGGSTYAVELRGQRYRESDDVTDMGDTDFEIGTNSDVFNGYGTFTANKTGRNQPAELFGMNGSSTNPSSVVRVCGMLNTNNDIDAIQFKTQSAPSSGIVYIYGR